MIIEKESAIIDKVGLKGTGTCRGDGGRDPMKIASARSRKGGGIVERMDVGGEGVGNTPVSLQCFHSASTDVFFMHVCVCAVEKEVREG